jgi:tetratricopeptide (TPR) repeat protein
VQVHTLSRCALFAAIGLTLLLPGCARSRLPGNPFASRKTGSESDSALRDARKNLKNSGETHLAHAKWREESGDLVGARSSYELVLGVDPDSVSAIIGLARLDQLAERHTEAEQGFLKALKMKPNDPHVLDSIGQFYASQERWDEAINALRKAMLAAPNETKSRYDLAVALARSGRIDEARPHFAKTIGDAESHYNIGYILYEQGRLADAQKELYQAVLKKPELEEAQAMLDDVRRERDDKTFLAGHTTPGNRIEDVPPPPATSNFNNRFQNQIRADAAPVIRTSGVGNSPLPTFPAGHGVGPTGHGVGNSDVTNPFMAPPLPPATNSGSGSLTPAQQEQLQNQLPGAP